MCNNLLKIFQCLHHNSRHHSLQMSWVLDLATVNYVLGSYLRVCCVELYAMSVLEQLLCEVLSAQATHPRGVSQKQSKLSKVKLNATTLP